MRRIFTSSFIAAALVATSFNSFAQCGWNTASNGAGVTNTFTSNNEGFTGDFSFSGGKLVSTTGAGVKTVTSPIFYLPPGLNNILVTFTLERVGGAGNTVTDVAATATTNSGTISLCSGTLASAVNPNAPVAYYLTIPRGALNQNTNFRLNLSFTTGGQYNFDNFGTNASTALGSLPVKFSSFEGKSINGSVNLVWHVASEENVARYDVEKSADNRNFVNIGNVEAKGSDSYSFVDTKATTATSYYRVKSVDIDGKLTYSPIVTMKGGKSSITLKGFPMPVISDFTLQHGTAVAGSEISVSSAEGRQLKTVIPAKGSQQTVISLASLTPGVYVIRYSNTNGEVETLKIVKQ
jgi:hypothetical protein